MDLDDCGDSLEALEALEAEDWNGGAASSDSTYNQKDNVTVLAPLIPSEYSALKAGHPPSKFVTA